MIHSPLLRRGLGWLWATAIAVIPFLLWPSIPAAATGIYQMPTVAPGAGPWVVDEATVLSRLNKGELSEKFEQLAAATGTEVRVVTLHRLDYGETPASFAAALLEKWFPDPAVRAHEVVVVLDDVTNGAAIARGEAVSELLTDAIATSVVEETIAIPLRQDNRYNQALLDAGDRLVAVLSGEADPGPPAAEETYAVARTFATAEETEENRSNSTVIVIGFLIAATVIPMATYYFYQSMGG